MSDNDGDPSSSVTSSLSSLMITHPSPHHHNVTNGKVSPVVWHALPVALWYHICTYMDLSSLLSMCRCNHQYHIIAMNDHIWRCAYLWHWTPLSSTSGAINRSHVRDRTTIATPMSIMDDDKRSSLSSIDTGVTWYDKYQRRRGIDERWGTPSSLRRTWQAHGSYVSCLHADKYDTLVSGGDDHNIYRWSLNNNSGALVSMTGHSSRVTSITMNAIRYNRVISADAFGCLAIWNMDSGAILEAPAPGSGNVNSNTKGSNGNGRLLTKAAARSPRLLAWIDEAHSLEVKCMSASWHMNDSSLRVATGSGDCNIKIWDATTASMIAICHGHHAAVNCVQMIDDHIILSASRDLSIRCWDTRIAATGRGASSPSSSTTRTGHTTYDSNDDDDSKNNRCVMTLDDAHDMFVTSLHSDGHYMVSAGYDGAVKYWDQRTWKCVSSFDMQDFVTQVHLISPGVHNGTGAILAASLGAKVIRHPLSHHHGHDHANNNDIQDTNRIGDSNDNDNGNVDRSLTVADGKLSSLYMDDERIISGYARDINIIDFTNAS